MRRKPFSKGRTRGIQRRNFTEISLRTSLTNWWSFIEIQNTLPASFLNIQRISMKLHRFVCLVQELPCELNPTGRPFETRNINKFSRSLKETGARHQNRVSCHIFVTRTYISGIFAPTDNSVSSLQTLTERTATDFPIWSSVSVFGVSEV